MEYTYRNGLQEKEVTICLQASKLVIVSGTAKHIIPYHEITETRLNKRKDLYFIHIYSSIFRTILVTNQTFGEDGERIDQSQHCRTFARTLHMHLLEKNNANYFKRFDLNSLFFLLGLCTVATSLLFFTDEYFLMCTRNPVGGGQANIFKWRFIVIRLVTKPMSRFYEPAKKPIPIKSGSY